MESAVAQALAADALHVAAVRQILEQRAQAAAQPPPLPVALPDDPRARDLGLLGLLQHLDEVVKADWVPWLLDVEEQERFRRSLERRVKTAKLGRFKPMTDFDWSWLRKLDRDHIDELFTLKFVDEGANIVLLGPNGVGKTMLSKNLAHRCLLRGHSVAFTTASEELRWKLERDGTGSSGSHAACGERRASALGGVGGGAPHRARGARGRAHGGGQGAAASRLGRARGAARRTARALVQGGRVRLREGNIDVLRSRLARGGIDLALLTELGDGAGGEPWGEDELVWVGAPSVTDGPVVTFAEAVRAHAVAGVGPALLSAQTVAGEVARGELVLEHRGVARLAPAAAALRALLIGLEAPSAS